MSVRPRPDVREALDEALREMRWLTRTYTRDIGAGMSIRAGDLMETRNRTK